MLPTRLAAPALRAPFAAVCWRPRALPPAFAARLRAGCSSALRELLAPELLLRELLLLARALGFAAERVLDLRAVELDLRAASSWTSTCVRSPACWRCCCVNASPPDDDELFRDDDARDLPPRRRRPPPLPLFDSAMSLSSSEISARYPLGRARTISCPKKP